MNQKILIVDDKPANLIALRQTLSVLDVNVISTVAAANSTGGSWGL